MLNPPFFPKFSRSSRSPAVTKGGTIYYCIWLAYATGVLEKAGHEVKLVDAPAVPISEKKVLAIIRRFKPEMVVLDTSTASIHNDVEVLRKVKKAHKCFGVLVGTHVSALPLETMEMSNAIDAVCIQEYDYTLRDLAKELGKKKPALAKVNGIVFRKGKKVVKNKLREKIQDLNKLPFVSAVYKKHLNYKNYFYSANLYPEIAILTGRGCPFNCKFCNWVQNLNPGPYRKRSVVNVIEEFKFIEKNFPDAKEVFLEDDTFTADHRWVNDFCKSKIKEKIKIKWSCNARADVPLETLQLMKKAGCRLLCVGFESGSQHVLNDVRKGTTLGKMKEFMDDSKKAGILVHGCFMVGNPEDNEETIKATIELAKKLNPDSAQFFPIMVYPGTQSYEHFKKSGQLVSTDFRQWVDENGWHNCMVSMPGLSNKEMVEWCDRARKEFYFRPKYIGKKALQVITQPSEFPRLWKGGKTFIKYIAKSKKETGKKTAINEKSVENEKKPIENGKKMNWARLSQDKPSITMQRLAKIALIRSDKAATRTKMAIARLKHRKKFVLRNVQGSNMYLNIKDKGICSDLYLRGKREDKATDELMKRVKPGMVIADVGANIGYYALMEAKAVGPKGKVYAIEPIPENIVLLKKNIAANDYKNIEVFNKAAGDKNCKKKIFISKQSNLSTFCENVELDQSGETIDVDVFTLDSFFKNREKPQIVRMDVEGYEYEILQGMKKTMKECKNLQFFIEVHADFMGEEKTVRFLKILKQNGITHCKIIRESSDILKFSEKILSKEIFPEEGEFNKTIGEIISEKKFHYGLYYLFAEKNGMMLLKKSI